MPYRRGDVVAVPYDYSDLTGGKIRPAVIVSSDDYNLAQRDVIVAGISTQLTRSRPYDHILLDWTVARLRYPSLVRGRLLTIEQRLIRRHVGYLSLRDLLAVEEKLATFLLSEITIIDSVLKRIDLTALPGSIVQALAEKCLQASRVLASQGSPAIDLDRLHKSLIPPDQP